MRCSRVCECRLCETPSRPGDLLACGGMRRTFSRVAYNLSIPLRRDCGAVGLSPALEFCTSTSSTYGITGVYTLPPYVTLAVDGEVTPGNTP